MTPFIGDIIMFGGNYAIRNFAFCNGQIMNISSQAALYSLVGTIYGGNGINTFGLPEMRGRIPVHRNNGGGVGGIPYPQGTLIGTSTNVLGSANLPTHNHEFQVSNNPETSMSPVNQVVGKGQHFLGTSATKLGDGTMYSGTVDNEGSSSHFGNMMPYQAINFMIALQGAFPNRN